MPCRSRFSDLTLEHRRNSHGLSFPMRRMIFFFIMWGVGRKAQVGTEVATRSNSSANMIVSTRLTTDFPFESLTSGSSYKSRWCAHPRQTRQSRVPRTGELSSVSTAGGRISLRKAIGKRRSASSNPWNFPGIWLLCYRLLRRARGDVDLDEHSWPGERGPHLARAEGFDESADAFDEHLSERAKRSALQSEDRNLMADIREFNG